MPKLKKFTLSVLVDLTMKEVGEVNLPRFDWKDIPDFLADIGEIGSLIHKAMWAVETVEDTPHPEYKYFPKVGIPGPIKEKAAVLAVLKILAIPVSLAIFQGIFDRIVPIIKWAIWLLNFRLGHDWLHTSEIFVMAEQLKTALKS